MPNELDARAADYLTVALKGLAGAVPGAGSLLAEIVGTVIPNQRMDRIASFAQQLDIRLKSLDERFVRAQVTNENFVDLMEEGVRQAARSLSDERREYIANLVAKSLDADGISYAESRHLLRVLGEINDVEVIRLGAYQYQTLGRGEEYRERHKAIVNPVAATFGADQRTMDAETLQNSYDAHLQQLGLLTRIIHQS